MIEKESELYRQCGEYVLMPAVLDQCTGEIKPLTKYGIHKKQLVYRHISEISENDQDAILLQQNKPYRKHKNR